jgi:plasmid stability protein
MASLTVRNIPDAAKLRFRQIAAAHGRSMEEHLRQLIIDAAVDTPSISVVQEAPQPFRTATKTGSGNWVKNLMELAQGTELRVPEWRGSERLAPDYPVGMEPLPGEAFVDHITRISRPGFELETERDRTPHREPRV